VSGFRQQGVDMDRPDIQRWVGNSQECIAALDAADRRDVNAAMDYLEDASQHNFGMFPERGEAFEQTKAYVVATLTG